MPPPASWKPPTSPLTWSTATRHLAGAWAPTWRAGARCWLGAGSAGRRAGQGVGPAGQVTGIDSSDPMLALGRRRCADLSGSGRVGFVKADAMALPFAAASFDVAVSTQVYEYVADLSRALAELYRILRPGGRALILDTDWDSIVWHASDPDLMRRVLAAWTQRFADPYLPHAGPPPPGGRFPGRPPGRAGVAQPRVRPRHLQRGQRRDHGRLRRRPGQPRPRSGRRLAGGPPPARPRGAVLLLASTATCSWPADSRYPTTAWDELRAALVVGASFSHHVQGGGDLAVRFLACPTPSRKHSANQPGTRADRWPAS